MDSDDAATNMRSVHAQPDARNVTIVRPSNRISGVYWSGPKRVSCCLYLGKLFGMFI